MPTNLFLYEDVFGVSPEVSVTAQAPTEFICPVCKAKTFPTEDALNEHIKTEHPWHWWFWYAPYKPALVGTSVGVVITLIVGPKLAGWY